MSVDLFGDPISDQPARTKAASLAGYPAVPGTGPAGATCKTCEHRATTGGGARRYQKCLLMRQHWTRGAGTDIKATSPACSRYCKEGGSA